MKNIIFSPVKKNDINIIIKKNFYKNLLDLHSKSSSTLFIADTKLRSYINIKNNLKFIKGGEEAKYLDKYLDLCQIIEKNNFNTVISLGGGALMDLTGYTLNTLNHAVNKIILVPTTLTAMVFPPISGYYCIDMNYKKDYLKTIGYPNEVYIDQEFLTTIPKQLLKKQFFSSYILGSYFSLKLSKLSLYYSQNFENIDLDDFLTTSVNLSLKFYSLNSEIPGYNLIKHFIKNPIEINSSFFEIYASIFILLSYISFIEGYISKERIKVYIQDLKYFGLFNKKKLLNLDKFIIKGNVKEIIQKNNSYTVQTFSHKEFNEHIKNFITFIRGENIE